MIQQFIAIIIIFFFIGRLYSQKKKNSISATEFFLWLIFWIFSIILIAGIKYVDSFVAFLGFSSSGINVMLYIAIAVLFYLLFRIRLKIEKLEKEITSLVRSVTLNNATKDKRP